MAIEVRSMRRTAALLPALLVALVLLAPSLAGAATKAEEPAPGDVSSATATKAASQDPNVAKEKREHPGLVPSTTFHNEKWEVGWFEDNREYALVMVDPKTGEVVESWTGYQVAWEMARGYSGEFAHSLNSPFVWIPLCLIFFVGLTDWRRLRRVANLDLLVLLGFGVSHFFFNQGNIGLSVPLAYPVLAYLLARCLWIGFRGRGTGLRPVWPTMWLLVAALFLMGFRVGLNMADAGAIDVGYAGVTGAHKIVHGEPLYGDFPEDIHSGDTYGPVNYAAYVPFEVIWPYTGEWDDLPAAHGASITFDIATFVLLLVLGMRIRPGPAGRRLGAILAFGWAAFPYTAYVLESDSNDALISALLVLTLVVLAKPLWRGVTISLATWAKFTPLMLAPMLLTYDADPASVRRPWRPVFSRPALLFAPGFAAITVVFMLWPAIDPGLKVFYERTIAAQAGRSSPFSVWGQDEALEPLRVAILAATGILAVALAFVPRRKSLLQVAAFGAALMLGVQITLHHWFYLYIVWFFPLMLIALCLLEPSEEPEPEDLPRLRGVRRRRAPEPSPARSNPPVPTG
ncbi:MAG TPA: PepSY domain-containing protein [Solirubrobacterales bacterium]|nr:PepSY domain-containing protein [Solirubrobacterales bacterium]